MTFIVLLIGIIIVAVSYKGTQGQLFTELKTDVPAFGVWAAAIVALGVIGFVPGLKPISRGLLGLVLLVIILNNYDKIIPGFKNSFAGTSAAPAATTTTAAADVAGNQASAINSAVAAIAPNLADTVATSPSTLIGAGN